MLAGKQRIVSDISLACFSVLATEANEVKLGEELLEIKPFSEAALSLKEFLCRCPNDFRDDATLSALRGRSSVAA